MKYRSLFVKVMFLDFGYEGISFRDNGISKAQLYVKESYVYFIFQNRVQCFLIEKFMKCRKFIRRLYQIRKWFMIDMFRVTLENKGSVVGEVQ